MLKVIAENFIESKHIETVLPLYRELVKKSAEEELCISYELFIDQKNPGHFIFIETWPDKNALDIHSQTPHFKKLVPMISEYHSQPGKILLMDSFE